MGCGASQPPAGLPAASDPAGPAVSVEAQTHTKLPPKYATPKAGQAANPTTPAAAASPVPGAPDLTKKAADALGQTTKGPEAGAVVASVPASVGASSSNSLADLKKEVERLVSLECWEPFSKTIFHGAFDGYEYVEGGLTGAHQKFQHLQVRVLGPLFPSQTEVMQKHIPDVFSKAAADNNEDDYSISCQNIHSFRSMAKSYLLHAIDFLAKAESDTAMQKAVGVFSTHINALEKEHTAAEEEAADEPEQSASIPAVEDLKKEVERLVSHEVWQPLSHRIYHGRFEGYETSEGTGFPLKGLHQKLQKLQVFLLGTALRSWFEWGERQKEHFPEVLEKAKEDTGDDEYSLECMNLHSFRDFAKAYLMRLLDYLPQEVTISILEKALAPFAERIDALEKAAAEIEDSYVLQFE